MTIRSLKKGEGSIQFSPFTSFNGFTPGIQFFIFLIIILISFSTESSGDVIVLKSGETFKTSKAWEENGKVKFYMQDLIVSVPMKDVSQILKENEAASPSEAETDPTPRNTPPLPPPSSIHRKSIPPKYYLEERKHPSSFKKSSSKQTGNQIGFRGLFWSMDRSQFKEFIKSKNDDGVELYYDPEDSLRFGNAFVDGIMYGFLENKLYMITIWVDGESRYQKLKAETFSQYGEGKRKNDTRERFVWSDVTTDRLLEYDKKIKTGILWMRSHEIAEQEKMK